MITAYSQEQQQHQQTQQNLFSGASCDNCRRKKVKCGRELPTCFLCYRFQQPCCYPKSNHRRHSEKPFQNMGKIDFNQTSPQSPTLQKLKKPAKNEKASVALKLATKVNTQGSNFVFKIQLPLTFKNSSPETMFPQQKLPSQVGDNTIRFEPHLVLMLLGQIVDKNTDVGIEVEWFLDQIKLGIFGGIIKSHIKLNNEWIKELYNPDFKKQTLENYFKFFHPIITYFSKQLFYERIDLIDPVLLSVILFVGYQYTGNMHKELLKYLEHQAKIQIRKSLLKVTKSNCQALFIFSYSMLFRGLAKQSLPYFNQACRISSILGIHLDMPGLSRIDQHERKCIRSMSICQDQHISSILCSHPYFISMLPLTSNLEPEFQVARGSYDDFDFLQAECICLTRWLYDKYWMPVSNLMTRFFLKFDLNKNSLNSKQLTANSDLLRILYNYCLVNTCEKFLVLTSRYNHPDYLPVIRNYLWALTCLYHQWILLIHSQSPPQFNQTTGEVDYYTRRSLQSAKSIFEIVKCNSIGTLYMYYHYLSAISFYYIKLYLSSCENINFQGEVLRELTKVYELVLRYKKEHSLSNDSLEALNEILKVLKIDFTSCNL
jgi:hypothetical protein